jgi:hypothetical protein
VTIQKEVIQNAQKIECLKKMSVKFFMQNHEFFAKSGISLTFIGVGVRIIEQTGHEKRV